LRTLATDCKAKIVVEALVPSAFGFASAFDTNAATIISLRLLTLAGLYNIRTTDKRYATQPCCRIADICSVAMHASDSPLCVCATASLKFYVLELP
jgi:hypothetical protein